MSENERRAGCKRVLVFPCGSEIGLEIHRALSLSPFVELYGASSVSSNHAKYVFERYIEGVPYVTAPDFVAELNRVVREHAIDFIYPAHDSVVVELARDAGELACPAITGPLETCEVCRRKGATYERLEDTVRIPKRYPWDEKDIPFPVFLKPDKGQGSKGVHLVESRGELDLFVEKDPSLLILEYLPGEEYTVDCFTDRHGRLRFAGARERVRTMNGISVDTRPVFDEEFDRMARAINRALTFRGAWFFQVKRDVAGAPVLMEAAPRISGCMGLYRNLGVNFPLLTLFDLQDYDVEVLCHGHGIEMDRALCSRFRLDIEYTHVYIDLDDTVIIDDKVNLQAISFIYQCRNKGVEVHLVSRHAGDIEATLRKYALTGLFDSVLHLDDLACKSESMAEEKAIFIDDSFAERKRVFEARGIPTFGVDAIESLLDWRV